MSPRVYICALSSRLIGDFSGRSMSHYKLDGTEEGKRRTCVKVIELGGSCSTAASLFFLESDKSRQTFPTWAFVDSEDSPAL